MVSFPMAKLIFVVVLGLISASEQCQNCPKGWKDFNDRCFKYFPQMYDWAQAESFCVDLGGHLASVHSAEEQQLLNDLIKAANPRHKLYWIGLTDCIKEGTWLWSDGSKVDYTRWAPNQPDNWKNDEDCVLPNQINWFGKKLWNDTMCGNKVSFICAKRSASKV